MVIMMNIKILNVYEFKGQLRVETETEYGIDNMGLSLDAQYLDDTGQPAWKNQVKDLINKKYGSRDKNKVLPKKQMFKADVGTTMTI